MIKNQAQKNGSLKKIEELEAEYKAIENDQKLSEIEREYFLDSVKYLIDQLQDEIGEYNGLKRSHFATLNIVSPKDLPLVLIKVRIAKGISQQQLATKLGIHKQQIQRNESVDNQNLSYQKLLEIAEALDIEIKFQEIEIVGKGTLFKLPDDIPEATVVAIEHFTSEKHSLLFN